MKEAFTFMAVCGVVYAAYAVLSLGMFSEVHRDEAVRKLGEISRSAHRGDLVGLAFRIAHPLYWLVSLPARSVAAALGVAFLMALPAFVIR